MQMNLCLHRLPVSTQGPKYFDYPIPRVVAGVDQSPGSSRVMWKPRGNQKNDRSARKWSKEDYCISTQAA
ncbi:hypothetical protein CRG98_012049 [Punica granatum]|uniref:Uncharacterized protein n=1 Tax=Punica granatum TaxID=22663 RepID=A0A2I0KG31_PUNGR|nr:hypothetical protein CRG98_012049 [Punica granatum]